MPQQVRVLVMRLFIQGPHQPLMGLLGMIGMTKK